MSEPVIRRTIDFPFSQQETLLRLAAGEHRSGAAIIRDALRLYALLKEQQPEILERYLHAEEDE